MAVRGLVRENHQLGAANEAMIFAEVFGEPNGVGYWREFLLTARTDADFADTLALHSSWDREQYVMKHAAAVAALVEVRQAGISDRDPQRDAQAVIGRLLVHPAWRQVVPASLQRVLAEDRTAAQHAPSPDLGEPADASTEGRGRSASARRAPTPGDTRDFAAWAAGQVSKGAAATRESATAWARERGLSREWARDELRRLPESQRLKVGQKLRSGPKPAAK